MDFEWDAAKSEECEVRRGFSFEDVLPAFVDPERSVVVDGRFDCGEERRILFGRVAGRMFAIVFAERAARARTISARKANKRERRVHGDGSGDA